MNKRINKFILMCLGVIMFGLYPNMVDAKSFSYDKGNIEKEGNITTIPIKLTLGASENISTFKINCETEHTDVSCKVELVDLTNFNNLDGTFAFIGETPLTSGDYTVVNLVLTNNESSKISDVEVYTKDMSIDGTAASEIRFSTSVGAKAPEKVESSDASLSGMTVSVGEISPEFSKDVTEYTIYNIKDTINKIKFSPKCTVENTCTAEISGGKSKSGYTVTLNQGENRILVDVTSEDGKNTITYAFNVIRGETSFNSAKLKSLSFGDYVMTPAFTPETTKYAITVSNEVNNLVELIEYVAEDSNAEESIKVSGLEDFKVGENKITIEITNVSGEETNKYEIIVTRLSEENIEILKYINDEVTFKDGDGIQTTLSIKEFEKQYPNEYEKIKNNEYKFDEDGNKIIEGLQEEEKETEEKGEKKKNNKVWIIVLLIIVGLAVIIVSGILIFKKKKTEVIEEPIEEKAETTEVEEEIQEDGIEEEIVGKFFSKDEDATVDIDEALSDLMSTKQYEFKDKE